MFTGIVEELGTVESVDHHEQAARLHIRSPHVLTEAAVGDSVAVAGCCLTITDHDGETFSADVIRTTLEATTLGGLTAGDRVDLERPLRADARLDGHIVQGHVDGVGRILTRDRGEHGDLLRIALPAAPTSISRYIVERGSIAVDGVSLTAVAVTDDVVTIGLIPETLERTTFGLREAGDPLNIEVDVLAKYVENLLPTAQATR